MNKLNYHVILLQDRECIGYANFTCLEECLDFISTSASKTGRVTITNDAHSLIASFIHSSKS
jgi:hypothetical protein